MTVRWKPLIVLSGLFCVVAVLGLLAIFIALPTNSGDTVAEARKHWKEGRYGHAEVQFKRALQVDGKNPKIHEEMADLYAAWAVAEPAKGGKLRVQRLHELGEAAKWDKRALAPRRALLADALQHDDPCEAYAKDVLSIDPDDNDAHFALAGELLKAPTPDTAALAKHLEVLDAREPNRPRTLWVKARLAKQVEDAAKLAEILAAARPLTLEKAEPTDRAALLNLRQMDVLNANDPATIAARVEAMKQTFDAVSSAGVIPSERLANVGRSIQEAQTHLDRIAAAASPDDRATIAAASATLDKTAESTFTQAIAALKTVDLNVYPEYAEHLLRRSHPEQCLATVKEGLANPLAAQAAWATTASRLRELGIKAALSDSKNPKRFEIAAPLVKEMLQSPTARYQALGNLFQGVIELEQSGLAEASTGIANGDGQAGIDAKHRTAALEHLRLAAGGLSDVATAQALYGVSLLMSGELGLGRQYLQNARALPNLEPRYQVWTAWAIVQAGYPEDAEPIVAPLLAGLADGKTPADLAPTLRLLSGEIHQARRTPEELRLAREDYQTALKSRDVDSPALRLRLAQIDLMLGDKGSANDAIAAIRKSGQGGAAAEHLAVLTLADAGKAAEAREALDKARVKYPDSEQLVGLDAALHIKANEPGKADAALAAFLKSHPNRPDVIQMRARVLANSLKKVDEARALLAPLAETSETSGPVVQLALLDLGRNDFDGMAKTIAKIRNRWTESSSGDLLDAQLSLAKGKTRDAAEFLDAALKKDPGNKVAMFWKAQLDDRTGATKQAAQAYEEILKERPNKEIDEGLSLTTAANWALATLALGNQEPDDAIARFEGLLREDNGKLDRPIHWQLVAAHSAKGDWPSAKAGIEALLKDPRTTTLERVRAANFYRLHGDVAGANRELETVLKADPGNSPAVAMRGFLLAQTQPVEAAALVRKAIAKSPQPESIYLMLSAIENLIPPKADGPARALAVLDEATGKFPESIALIAARYRVMKLQDGGDKAALAYLQEKVKNDPSGEVHRLLVDVYRDSGRYADAEAILRDLIALKPNDEALAAMLIRLVAFQAIDAATKGDRTTEASLNDKTARLIREDRVKFPKEIVFIQAECELDARRGKFDEAITLSAEIDALDANSPVAPALRAEIAKAQGATQTMAEQYAEAVNRAPRRPDLRLALGEADLALGKTDDALKQAEWLLDSQANLATAAVLLKARALAAHQGTSAETEAGIAQAERVLLDAIKIQPTFTAAYHLLSELYGRSNRRADAVKALKAGLSRAKDDNAGLSMLVQTLTEPRPGGEAPSQADRQEAVEWAEKFGGKDDNGQMALALAIGFHKAGQIDLALPWAEKAVAKLDTWLAHLNLGDLILSKAEATSDKHAAQALFEKAAEQYDLVLKTNANSIEAVNNKAWILHEYLGRDSDALLLAEAFQKRANPATLPPDFLDTLGAIQESMNKASDAERSYAAGLTKSPDHPILNYHMGRLLSRKPNQADRALEHLRKARAGSSSMPAPMTADVEALIKQVETTK